MFGGASIRIWADEHAHITDKMRSLTKEASFWDTLGVYFELEAVSRSLRTSPPEAARAGNGPVGDSGVIDDEDRLFIFLAKRKRTARSLPLREPPDNLMRDKDSQFEELLMLQSMGDY